VKQFKNDKNMSIINETNKPTKGDKKGTRWKDTTLGNLRILQKGQITRGTKKIQVLEPSRPIERSTLDKERGGTYKRMPSLDEPSPIITTHFKIKVVYTCHNATDILCM
jgi:hypothetical protein